MRRRSHGTDGLVTRRRLLVGAGTGLTSAGLVSTGAFSNVSGSRQAEISIVSDPNGSVGLYVYDQVEKNSKDPLVDVTNNYTKTLTVTISLVDCTRGTLEAPDGETGCSVTSTVDPGNTRNWSITSNVGSSTTVSFDVSATATDFQFDARRSTTAVNKSTNAVTIKKFQMAKGNNPGAVDTTNDQFNVKEIRIEDNDNDDDVTRRKFTVTDSNGDSVPLTNGQDDPDRSFAATAQWTESSITLQADENLTNGETYTVKLTGYDADGNRDTETRTP